MNTNLKVSIITVCLNCLEAVVPTMESVFGQIYDNKELIVIDGGSTDGTLEYLRSISNKISVLISEPDKGIYDAMRKGVEHATGDYVFFMNAGDRFANDRVVKTVMSDPKVLGSRPNIISGRVQFEYYGELLNLFRPSKPGQEGQGLPHQGTFVLTSLQKENPFDVRFRYVGDYEFWKRLQSKGLFEVYFTGHTIAIFSLGGASTTLKNDAKRYLERVYVDYLYSGKFGIIDFLKFFFKVSIRRCFFLFLGNKNVFILLRIIKYFKKRY